ncbi:MAG: response regulator, partial [Anaerolineae bacterium]
MSLSSTGPKTPISGDILIVDDTPANLRLLSGILVERGHKVRLAPNGKLALISAQAIPPDLILLDIMMPDMNGYEVCERLKADPRTRDIPVIFISALAQTEDKVKAFTLGGVDYVTKPFHVEEVLARVETHLALHVLQRQLAATNAELQEANAELEASNARLDEEKTRVEAARAMLWTVLNSQDALVYVADMDTYEVLFANAQLEQVFGQVEGCICWQALQEGQTGPCSFCSTPALLDEQGQPRGIYRWQFQNTRNGRWYTVADSAIEWVDGRLVRFSMAIDVTENKQAEAQLLAQQRLVAAIDERERVGRDLHDDLGQVMGYVNVQAQTAQDLLAQGRLEQVRATLSQLKDIAQEASDKVRQYILGIRTAYPAASLDFLQALEQYLNKLRQRYGLQVHVDCPDALHDNPLAPDVETQLLHIIQESLTNVCKHAETRSARLVFTLHPDEIQVLVIDEGQGFDLTPGPRPLASEGHFGLTIMRERAEGVGGSLDIQSQPGAGTRITARLPRMLEVKVDEDIRGLRVLLVDDHELYLKGLRNLLSTRGVHVVGLAHDGLQAEKMACELLPDLILMDVEMPRCDGLEATRRIKAVLPEVRIVMLTIAADDE